MDDTGDAPRILVLGGERDEQAQATDALTFGGIKALALDEQAEFDEQVGDRHPDLFVVNVAPTSKGSGRIRLLRARFPEAKVLALAKAPDHAVVSAALHAGAVGVVFTPCDPNRLLEAVVIAIGDAIPTAAANRDEQSIFKQARVVLCGAAEDIELIARTMECLATITPHAASTSVQRLPQTAIAADVLIVMPAARRVGSEIWGRLAAEIGPGIILVDDHARPAPPADDGPVLHLRTRMLDRQLPDVVCTAAATRARRCLRRELENERPIAPNAIKVLETACVRDRPPRFVNEAAEFVGVDRSRAASEWALTHAATHCPRLRQAFDWVLLWRVVLEKKPGIRWPTACARSDLKRGRLDAIARRLAGRTLAHLLDFDDWRAFSPFRAMRVFGTHVERSNYEGR